jgi:MOB kinase activator 1
MSGFITTMFVSSPNSHCPSYPAKPEPLRPIFTFAQSQSCMTLRMDLDVLDCEEKVMAGSGVALDLARPKKTYQSPLQRIG